MSKIRMVSAFKREPLPGVEMLTTDAAKEVADRTQFTGGLGNHVYVNGFDLARVEAAGLRDPRIVAMLEAHGWHSPSDVQWFKNGDTTYTPHTLADAVLAVVTGFTVDSPAVPTETSEHDRDRPAELEMARPAGLEPTTFRSAT